MAAIRYRGTWTESRYRNDLALLRSWIGAQGLVETGANPIWARYVPTFSAPESRNNRFTIRMKKPVSTKFSANENVATLTIGPAMP